MNTVKKLQGLPRNGHWLTFLVLVTLGTLILFFLGCGSDSKPAKNEKAAAHKGNASQASVPLVLGNQGAQPEVGKSAVKAHPERKIVEPPGFSREEMERRNAAALKIAESPGIEVAPGITREEMEKRNEEALKFAQSPDVEVMPGVTREEMLRRNAEAVKAAPPGWTERMKQLEKQAAEQPPAKPQFPPAAEK